MASISGKGSRWVLYIVNLVHDANEIGRTFC